MINKTDITTEYYNTKLPKVIFSYIFEMDPTFNPGIRLVCKTWKDAFDRSCTLMWQQNMVGKNSKIPLDLKERLICFQDELFKICPELEKNGFLILQEFFCRKMNLKFKPIPEISKCVENELRAQEEILFVMMEKIKGMTKTKKVTWTENRSVTRSVPIGESTFGTIGFKVNSGYQNVTFYETVNCSRYEDVPIFKFAGSPPRTATEIVEWLKNNKISTKLDFGTIKLKNLPFGFSILKSFKNLDLNLCKSELIKCPIAISMLQLKTLELSHNKITAFPEEEIKKLTNLKKLDLSHNQLTEISDRIFHMKCDIVLNNNKLVLKKRIMRIPTSNLKNLLKSELSEFFNIELLNQERAVPALNPLAKLYQAIICQNKQGRELVPFVNALPNEDKDLFYNMIVKCEKTANPSSELLNNNPPGETICFSVSQDVFDSAVEKTILQIAEKVQSDDIELDILSAESERSNEELKEYESINLMDLANIKGSK